MNVAILLSVGAFAVSVLSLAFSILSWRETHRPRLIARVSTVAAGNVSTALQLVVENVGSDPARAVSLSCDPKDLQQALHPSASGPLREDVRRCFQDNRVIHVLEPGRPVTCAFGMLTPREDSTWVPDKQLPIAIHYQNMHGRRRFTDQVILQLSDDASFTGLQWNTRKTQAG